MRIVLGKFALRIVLPSPLPSVTIYRVLYEAIYSSLAMQLGGLFGKLTTQMVEQLNSFQRSGDPAKYLMRGEKKKNNDKYESQCLS